MVEDRLRWCLHWLAKGGFAVTDLKKDSLCLCVRARVRACVRVCVCVERTGHESEGRNAMAARKTKRKRFSADKKGEKGKSWTQIEGDRERGGWWRKEWQQVNDGQPYREKRSSPLLHTCDRKETEPRHSKRGGSDSFPQRTDVGDPARVLTQTRRRRFSVESVIREESTSGRFRGLTGQQHFDVWSQLVNTSGRL